MRISSQKTQHRIYVVGEALLDGETPDRLALYLPDGTPMDLNAADPDTMQWHGAWDADTTYPNESVVTFDSTLWIAIQDVPVGITPGTDPAMWEEMVAAAEGGGGLPPGGTYAMLLAKASSTDGDAVWIMPPLELPGGGPSGYILRKASSADGHVSWVAPSVGVPNELPPSGATGYILAKGSEETGDVIWIEPPSGGGSGLPAGGLTAQVLAKASEADGDAAWVPATPRDMPVGGASGALLAKSSGADRDVGWVAPPHDLPVGGASGYILAKASSADRDVGWVPAPSGGGSVYELPVGGSTNQVLAKASATDRDVAWVAPTPRDVPVGGSTGQVLTKNSSTDRDTGWATPSGGGGGSIDGIYLDEKFDTDTHLLYVEATTAASPTFVSGSAGQSYLYNPVSDGYFNRSDKAASIRNPMVLIETEWNGDSGHVIAIRLRRQSDRWIQIQVHPTNIHIYTTGPSSGADQLRTSTPVATLSAGRRAWIVAGVYHNQVFASFSEHHPFAASLTATRNSCVFDISTVADLGVEAQRIGRADQVRLAPGATNQSLHRLFRHTIIDLDTFPTLP